MDFMHFPNKREGSMPRGKDQIDDDPVYIGKGQTTKKAAYDAFRIAREHGVHVGTDLEQLLMAQNKNSTESIFVNTEDIAGRCCYFVLRP